MGQDPQPALDAFSQEYGLSLPLVPDLDPYVASDAYGIVSAPTAVAVGSDGTILDVAESWDRDAWNRLAAGFAGALGAEPGDGVRRGRRPAGLQTRLNHEERPLGLSGDAGPPRAR